jgi:hypothetical protein
MKRFTCSIAPPLFFGLVLTSVVVGWWGIVRCPPSAPVAPPSDALPGAWLHGDNRVAERFQASRDGLSGLAVWLVATSETSQVAFQLRQADIKTPIARGEATVDNWGSPSLYAFTFPALRDSHEQEYILELAATADSPPSAVYFLPHERPGGGLLLQGETAGGQNVLETCYYPGDRASWSEYIFDSTLDAYPTLSLLLDRLSQYKPFYYKRAFWVLWGIVTFVLLTWLVVYSVGDVLPRTRWSLKQSLRTAVILAWAVLMALVGYGFWHGKVGAVTGVSPGGAFPEVSEPTQPLVAQDLLLTLAAGEDVSVDAPEDWYVSAGHLAQGDDWRPVLRMHAPSSAVFTVTVPPGAVFHSAAALSPEVWLPDRGDGVLFVVHILVDGVEETVYHQEIDPKSNPEERHWHDFEVDLSSYAGRTIQIALITYPLETNEWDQAVWGMPVLLTSYPTEP